MAHGRGTAMNQMLLGKEQIQDNLDTLAQLVDQQQLDLLALQELDIDSFWAGGFDQAQWLLGKTAFNCAALGMHAETWFYRFGTALLSSIQLHQARSLSFDPTPPSTTKGLVAARIHWLHLGESMPVLVISVHLDFSRKSVRERQLANIIQTVASSPLPIILMGDFNEQWQEEDSVVRQLVEQADLHAYEPASTVHPTYKAKRLDWILLSDDFEITSYSTAMDAVSDHRLVVAEIRWRDPQ
ncbi:hypothetical protein FV139_13180 [Parahaliea maris]|uniref:Endonuclease/exonuclease/phosphatase domain-containing protein n=1 Tax=Parahaliea maris TaxID=2716870 RepID=A0A5C8ZYM6_9GAMM|nr:endonuclease/exonuclease/phosphatase family protein [Parahaliea maris]TXS92909.1 hypothetical protein FV139_13180 [Parahaliea maris]